MTSESMGPLKLWNIFTDDWLNTRQAMNLLFLATLFAFALAPMLLGIVDPTGMRISARLPLDVVAAIGTVSLLSLWLAMLRYWARLDSSKAYAKRLWFVILVFGFGYGSCIYYFLVYRPQVLRKLRVTS